jgi:acetyl-CoA carboxylase carboxyltransferase component
MGPNAAVNAVFFNKIQAVPEGPERDALVQKLRDEYRADVDLEKLASEMVIDGIIPSADLRREVARRFARYENKVEATPRKKHIVVPV